MHERTPVHRKTCIPKLEQIVSLCASPTGKPCLAALVRLDLSETEMAHMEVA